MISLFDLTLPLKLSQLILNILRITTNYWGISVLEIASSVFPESRNVSAHCQSPISGLIWTRRRCASQSSDLLLFASARSLPRISPRISTPVPSSEEASFLLLSGVGGAWFPFTFSLASYWHLYLRYLVVTLHLQYPGSRCLHLAPADFLSRAILRRPPHPAVFQLQRLNHCHDIKDDLKPFLLVIGASRNCYVWNAIYFIILYSGHL